MVKCKIKVGKIKGLRTIKWLSKMNRFIVAHFMLQNVFRIFFFSCFNVFRLQC